ncbi:hypothetical protein Bbelb_312790 [Branchiostoma belcheri]|nr:hypothetical protein Bbelb_312790 [Branchiostoma belcheri]
MTERDGIPVFPFPVACLRTDQKSLEPVTRTLQRVLAACSASVRTSLQGLDYFTAEGGRAFDNLEGVVETLADHLGEDWAKKQTAILRSSKRYLKGDYKDSNAVVSVLEHTVQQLKAELPALKSVYVRSDNAGCYHNTLILQAAKHISEATGVTIRRVDYCDPQGGKGSCDRKAATVKSHIKSWINEGHNVETADEFKTAVESHGGIPGVKVFLCEVDTEETVTSIKLDGISKLNNFEFTEAGLRVWRAYNIGEGNLIPGSRFPAVKPPTLKIVSQPSNPGSAFRPMKSRQKKLHVQQGEESDSDGETGLSTEQQGCGSIFPCPEDSCIRVYKTFKGLEEHIAVGKHRRRLERETLLDKAKLKYAERLEQGPSAVPHVEPSLQLEAKRNTPCPQQGWALRSPKKPVRFTIKQKTYLDRQFLLGETTGKKLDPVTVSREMRKACDSQDQRLFRVTEFLTSQQVSSYFSRLAAKRRKTAADADAEDEQQDPAELESIHSALQTHVMKEVQLQHPVLYDTYNLCDMAKRGELYELGMPSLKIICDHFDIDVSTITDRRRKSAFVAKVTEYLRFCQCHTGRI